MKRSGPSLTLPERGRVEIELDDLRDLFENVPCGLISMARDGRIKAVNEAFLDITGYRRDDLVGSVQFRDLLAAGGQIFYETHLAPMLDMQRFVRELAIEIVRADGARLPMLLSAVVRPSADGSSEVVQMVLLDATERRAYETELLRSRSRMERLHQIARRVGVSLDPDELAAVSLDELIDGVTVAGAVLLAVSDEDTGPVVLAARATTPELCDEWLSLDVEGVPWLVDALQSLAPTFIDDLTTRDERSPALVDDRGSSARLALLPLVADGRPIGLLCAASPAETGFQSDEQMFLSTAAKTIAQSMDRARLHQRTMEASRRTLFLSSISRELFEEPLSFVGRAELVVDRLVPEHADFATVELIEDRLAPIAARHRDPDLLVPLIALRRLARVDDQRPGTTASGRPIGEPLLVPDVSDATLAEFELSDDELALTSQLAPRSFVGLPLLSRGREVGALILGMSSSGRRYSPGQLPFLVLLADRVALALENARLHELEQGLARRLQMNLLPSARVDDPRVQIASRYRAAVETMTIGGDWHDAFLVNDDKVAVAVGDVVGHDEAAALAMGQLSTALRAFALEGGGPAATLRRLSRFAATVPGGRCATVSYAEIDIARRRVVYASAGHMPPILQRPGERSRALWEGRMPALGTELDSQGDEPSEPIEAIEALPEGSALLLFSDGLVESRSVPFDESLAALLARIDDLPQLVTSATADEVLDELVGLAPPTDDVCVLAVSLVPSP